MASVVGRNFYIDYSLADGSVRQFEAAGYTLYDEDKGIAVEDWEQHLCAFIESVGWHTSPGRMRFVEKLIEEGKLGDGQTKPHGYGT